MKELKTISDEKLLRQIQSGNDDAMECLLERYRDMGRKEARRKEHFVFNVCLSVCAKTDLYNDHCI